MDMTPQAGALFRFIERTIVAELANERAFLADYDAVRRSSQSVADLPDRMIDLFIRFYLQNNGCLPPARRTGLFSALSDEEVARMEAAVQAVYESGGADDE